MQTKTVLENAHAVQEASSLPQGTRRTTASQGHALLGTISFRRKVSKPSTFKKMYIVVRWYRRSGDMVPAFRRGGTAVPAFVNHRSGVLVPPFRRKWYRPAQGPHANIFSSEPRGALPLRRIRSPAQGGAGEGPF